MERQQGLNRLVTAAAVRTGDPEVDRRGNTLMATLALTAPAMVVSAIIFWTAPNGQLSAAVTICVGVLAVCLLPICRAGHVEFTAYAFLTLLWVLVVAQPVISGDLSTNASLVAPVGAFILFVLPYHRRWMAGVWAATAILALWFGTNDADTYLTPRDVQLLNAAVVAASAILVIGFAAGQLLLAARRQRELTARLREKEGRLTEMERAANTDALTGLANRRALAPLLDESVPLCAETAVALVDLDNFKDVNDQMSHSAGDRVLSKFAELLRSSLRSTDMIFRLGGDEFLVVAESGGTKGLMTSLERHRQALRNSSWCDLPEALRPTMSAGVTSAADLTLNQAIQRADELLRTAKRSGRDRITI